MARAWKDPKPALEVALARFRTKHSATNRETRVSARSCSYLLAVCIGVWAQLLCPARPVCATVLIVTSDALPQYKAPLDTFREHTSRTTSLVAIGGSREHAEELLRQAAKDAAPRAIFALGAKAAYLCRLILPKIPMVFAMVVNRGRYGLDRGPVTGVDLEMSPRALFTRFKLVLPDLSRLGVIYSRASDPRRLDLARQAARELDIKLVEEEVANSDEVGGAYRRMHTGIDALWMLPDPLVVTRDNFAYLATRTRNDRIAFLAFSENFVRAGALMSVGPSYATMGSQAAALLERLLASPNDPPPIQAPVGSKLVINARSAERIGVPLDAATSRMADTIVGSGQAVEEGEK